MAPSASLMEEKTILANENALENIEKTPNISIKLNSKEIDTLTNLGILHEDQSIDHKAIKKLYYNSDYYLEQVMNVSIENGKDNEYNYSETINGDDRPMPQNEYELFMKDIKDDLRERETRNEKRYDRIHAELLQHKQETEKRDEQFRQEAKEREERYIKNTDEIKQIVNNAYFNLDNKIDKSNEKIEKINKHVETMVDTNQKHYIATTLTILGIVAGAVVTIIFT